MGFRFTAQDIANNLGIFGWVKNLGDGRLEIIAEAEESLLEQFLTRINQYFQEYIQGKEIKWQDGSGEFQEFKIKF